MKYAKKLGLMVVAAAALMAFVGASTASASVLCSNSSAVPCPSPVPKGTVLDFSLEGSAALTNTAGTETLDTCTSGTVKGPVEDPGGSTKTVLGKVTTLTWGGPGTECLHTTTTISTGTLEIHNIAGTAEGTVTASGFKVTIAITPTLSCTYGTGEGKDLGTLTDVKPATIDINAMISKIEGSFLCPSSGVWKANYVLTEPANTTLAVTPS